MYITCQCRHPYVQTTFSIDNTNNTQAHTRTLEHVFTKNKSILFTFSFNWVMIKQYAGYHLSMT